MLFSGDKLLGGPQAGIIIGKKKYIQAMKRHPLARVVRIDKMTLAALEAVFFEYQDPDKVLENIPALRMLTCPREKLYKRALRLKENLMSDAGTLHVNVEPCEDFVGGGSAPDVRLEGWAVTLHSDIRTTKQIEYALRKSQTPIISHISQDKVWLHMRTIFDQDMAAIAESIIKLKG